MEDSAADRRGGLAGRLVLLAGATFLALAAAEIGLRLLYPLDAPLLEPDPELLFRLRPGARSIQVEAGTERRVDVRIDPEGYRGPGLDERPGRRIVVLGDSFVLGAFSPLEATFPARLEALLGSVEGVGPEVVNAGVPGYGPDQAILRLGHEIDRLAPETVLLAVFLGNDLGDLVRNKLFGIGSSGKLEERPTVLHSEMHAQLRDAPRRLLVGRLLGGFLKGRGRSPGRPLADEMEEWRRFQIAELNDYFENDVAVRLFEDHYDIGIAADPAGPGARLAASLMAGVLQRGRRSAAAAGARFLVVAIPPSIDVCAAPAGRVDADRFPEYGPDHLRLLLHWAALRAGVELLDLTDVFRAVPESEGGPCGLYFPGDSAHWNDAGQALAARVVAEHLAGGGG